MMLPSYVVATVKLCTRARTTRTFPQLQPPITLCLFIHTRETVGKEVAARSDALSVQHKHSNQPVVHEEEEEEAVVNSGRN